MTTPEAGDLAAVPLFGGLGEDALAVLTGWVDTETYETGRRLTHQGSSGYAFFVLRDGTAEVRVDGERVRELGPGDFFGEISILGGGRQTATVTVTTPATVWVMFGTRFRELQAQHPDIAAVLEKTARERLETA